MDKGLIPLLHYFRQFINYFLCMLISVLITIALVSGTLYLYIELSLPSVAVLNKKPAGAVRIDQVPKQLIQAVLATEDSRFYSHPGIDMRGIVRAALVVLSTGRKAQGASTITMQVARHFFLTRQKTYLRKWKEILLAIKIEQNFSKDKILELYLNTIYFGNGAHGITAAARVYYKKKLNELDLPEMAMLAGIPQSPSRVNPINNSHAAFDRRNHVLKRMLREGYINQETYEEAIDTGV